MSWTAAQVTVGKACYLHMLVLQFSTYSMEVAQSSSHEIINFDL